MWYNIIVALGLKSIGTQAIEAPEFIRGDTYLL